MALLGLDASREPWSRPMSLFLAGVHVQRARSTPGATEHTLVSRVTRHIAMQGQPGSGRQPSTSLIVPTGCWPSHGLCYHLALSWATSVQGRHPYRWASNNVVLLGNGALI